MSLKKYIQNNDLVMFACINILLLLQDHERAYFDSADWVLGKVPVHIQKLNSIIYCIYKLDVLST